MADSGEIVYRAADDGQLHVATLDGASRPLTASPGPGEAAVEPAWSRDGTRIVFSTSAGGVYLVNADGSGPRQIGGAGTCHPSWSPQGDVVYVRDDSAGRFFAATGATWVMSPDGTDQRRLGSRTASGTVGWAPVRDSSTVDLLSTRSRRH